MRMRMRMQMLTQPTPKGYFARRGERSFEMDRFPWPRSGHLHAHAAAMSALKINIATQPFPWTAAALAAHAGVPLDWSADGELAYAGARGVQPVEQALSALYKGKEAALPVLPAEFNASTPFPAIPGILNTLDDHLALRTTFAAPHSAVPGATDLKVWGTIRANLKVIGVLKQGKHAHLGRWYAWVEGLDGTQEVVKGLFDAKSSNVSPEPRSEPRSEATTASPPSDRREREYLLVERSESTCLVEQASIPSRRAKREYLSRRAQREYLLVERSERTSASGRDMRGRRRTAEISARRAQREYQRRRQTHPRPS